MKILLGEIKNVLLQISQQSRSTLISSNNDRFTLFYQCRSNPVLTGFIAISCLFCKQPKSHIYF